MVGGKRMIAGLALLAAALVWGAGGCRKREPWNVLIITMDTTRADHLRCYGYDRIETPNLNGLAQHGVLFERAYSHIPVTLPAHTSIMTGMPPRVHGVIDNGGYKVGDELETLGEVLKGRGYQTAAFISAAVLKKTFNLNQGFDHWDEEDISHQEKGRTLVSDRKADRTTDAALAWLSANRGRPFFMWVHYYDPHAAYDPPEPFAALYERLLYDGEIAFMDQQIGRLVSAVDQAGAGERTMIVAIADHGESLNEHGEQTHATFIYEPTMHIPFIIVVPGKGTLAGRRLQSVVSQSDVMPTVLDYLGVPAPSKVLGESLRPIMETDPEPERLRYVFLEATFSLLHNGWAPLSGLVGPRYKYINAPRPELYDLGEDPGELQNLLDGDSQSLSGPVRSALSLHRVYLDKKEKELTALKMETEEATLSFEEEQQLKALGYLVGGFHGDAVKAADKDPKDYVQLLPVIMLERQSVEEGNFEQALGCAEFVLTKDPENPQALFHRAYALFGVGRPLDALTAYEHMFEMIGRETFEARMDMGFIYMQLAQEQFDADPEKMKYYYELAVTSFEKSIAIRKAHPNREAHYYIGRIYLGLGDLSRAHERFFDPSLQDTDLGFVGKALLYEREGRMELAEAEFKKAMEVIEGGDEEKNYSTVYWTEWGQFLMRQGRYQEAVTFFEKTLVTDKQLAANQRFMRILEEARKGLGNGTGEPD